jgi:hypothetical protein
MTASKLPATNQDALVSPRYSVVGMYGNGGAVRHAAVLRRESVLTYGQEAVVAHMAPPLGLDDLIPAHVLGRIDVLTRDEQDSLEAWLADLQTKKRIPHDYQIHPPYEAIYDPVTLILKRRRMSCVGFILLCYMEALGLDLLDRTDGEFPRIDIATLQSCFPDLSLTRRLLGRYGVTGNGPWPVVMPGYLMHALARFKSALRPTAYLPQTSDVEFP